MSDRDPASSDPVSTAMVERLHADGYLSREAYDRARSLVWPGGRMLRWLQRGLLGAGAALVLAGIGYWFAFAWEAIPRLGKLGIIEGVFVVAAATGAIRGLDDPLGRIGLAAASASVGGFLLVFGSVYPTGAPSWRFFGGWAVLAVGFVALGRSQALWVVWLGLVDAAAAAYWLETAAASSQGGFTLASTAIGVYTLLAAGFAELLRELADPPWLEPPWSRWVLLGTGLLFLSVPVWTYVGLGWAAASWVSFFGTFVVWMAALCGAYFYFRRVRFDLVALTIVGLVAVSTPTMRLISGVTRHLSLGIALLAGGVTVLVGSALLVRWLTGLDDDAGDTDGPESTEGEAR